MVYTNDRFDHTMPILENQHFLTMMHMKPNILESSHRNLVQYLSSKEYINSIYAASIDNMYSSESDTKFHYPLSKSTYPSVIGLPNFEMSYQNIHPSNLVNSCPLQLL